MPPLENYLEQADKLAQDVVDGWEVNVAAGNAALLTTQFKALVDKACLYRNARKLADNHREHNVLSEREAAEEKATRQVFAEACKAFHEKPAA
jgi:hypothetical protein